MKSKFNKYLLSLALVLFCATMYAQKGGDVPVPGTNDGPAPNPGLPIDGGLSLLFISGIAYGVYELKRKK